jgi:CheY-like chemotaxis protein
MERLLNRVLGEGLDLSFKPCGKPLHVKLDAEQFEQVLVNLAANARDAMEASGGRLEIRSRIMDVGKNSDLKWELRPARYAVLEVEDHGSGMDSTTLARIFEPFFTTKPKGRGTGLGLATAYGTIKQMGGHLAAESRVGRGSTFSIYLPLSRAGEEAPVRAEPGRSDGRGSETVLVVEDEPGVLRLAVRGLESFGYTVWSAKDAEEALRLLDGREQKVDLLLADVILPGRSGRKLAEELLSRNPRVRVIYVSGRTDDELIRQETGGARPNFLRKPYKPIDLARKVREVLDRV